MSVHITTSIILLKSIFMDPKGKTLPPRIAGICCLCQILWEQPSISRYSSLIFPDSTISKQIFKYNNIPQVNPTISFLIVEKHKDKNNCTKLSKQNYQRKEEYNYYRIIIQVSSSLAHFQFSLKETHFTHKSRCISQDIHFDFISSSIALRDNTKLSKLVMRTTLSCSHRKKNISA